jgi:hypothetical protein
MDDWQEIPMFENYFINSDGDVRNRHGLLLRRHYNTTNRAYITLSKEGKHYPKALSLLVAQSFIPCSHEYWTTPMHLDGDYTNCSAANLVWRPRWVAVRYHQERRVCPYPTWGNKIILVETGEIFANPCEAAPVYGVLEREIFRSIGLHRTCFPINMHFQYYK